ncbi:hypothetical protein BH10BAC2_BH10BAC2_18180 [soil metagenome]
MSVQKAYDAWAGQYDTNINKTRDLEAVALRKTLAGISFGNCLEIGCGTGKNTVWLINKAKHITAIDLSTEMLSKAREKINNNTVEFIQADITTDCSFAKKEYDLVTFSLVLEHIENLTPIFEKVAQSLKAGGHVYIGELHPFKQYSGSKARFDTGEGTQVVACFIHHISDFIQAAKKNGFTLVEADEYFDDNDRSAIPRILTILLRKL